MIALWVILLITAWLFIGIAFARHFRVALTELADVTQVGTGWLLILAWPVYALVLLWIEAMIRLVDFGELGDRLAQVARTEVELGDRLAQVARTEVETAEALERMAWRMEELARLTQNIALANDPFREPDTQEVPHGEW